MKKSKNPRYQKEKNTWLSSSVSRWKLKKLEDFSSRDLNSKVCVCVSVLHILSKTEKKTRKRKIYVYIKDRTTAPTIHLGLTEVSVDGTDSNQAHGKSSESSSWESKGSCENQITAFPEENKLLHEITEKEYL